MSKDWTAEELKAASEAMKTAGHMSYEELCEELKRQDELKKQPPVKHEAVRYYSTQRPVSLGTFPSGHKVKEIFNFDERTFVESIGRKAWGWIEFEDELTEREARNYELVKEAEEKERRE